MALPVVFVCGATGTQGGAVARELRAKGVEVHALVRDATSVSAKAIESIGVKVWPGDYDNEEALENALVGCTSIFLNLMPSFQDFSTETRWATAILDAGKKAGVTQAVYSSSFGTKGRENNKYYDPNSLVATVLKSKATNEEAVRNAGFDHWTILRPGNFMANFIKPFVSMYGGLVEKGVWQTGFTASTVLPMVDTKTVGLFGAAAILEPAKFNKKEISYADELVSLDQILENLRRATGRDLKFEYMTDEEIEAQKASNPFIIGQLLMRDMATLVDMEEVETWGIPLTTFSGYLERESARVHETYAQPA